MVRKNREEKSKNYQQNREKSKLSHVVSDTSFASV